MSQRLQKWAPLLIVTSLILLLDQVSKGIVLANLELNQSWEIPLLYPYLRVTYIANTGIAFGMGEGGSTIFTILSILITIFLLDMYRRSDRNAHGQHIAMGLIIGGAIGNIIDRLQHGYVVDFVHLYIPRIISNVSNFADHAIVIGVIVLGITTFIEERRQAKNSLLQPEPDPID